MQTRQGPGRLLSHRVTPRAAGCDRALRFARCVASASHARPGHHAVHAVHGPAPPCLPPAHRSSSPSCEPSAQQTAPAHPAARARPRHCRRSRPWRRRGTRPGGGSQRRRAARVRLRRRPVQRATASAGRHCQKHGWQQNGAWEVGLGSAAGAGRNGVLAAGCAVVMQPQAYAQGSRPRAACCHNNARSGIR